MQKKRIIMLGGVKHCGKSTLGKLLAELLGASFADTDTLLEKLYFEQSGEKASCREIFRQLGEENFRRLEADAIMGFAASATGKWVAALGGGAVANQFIPWQQLTVLRVMADAPEEVIRERILASGIPPFLGGSIDISRPNIQKLIDLRSYYRITGRHPGYKVLNPDDPILHKKEES